MRNHALKSSSTFLPVWLLALAIMGSACQQTSTVTTTNTNTANANANMSPSVNTNSSPVTSDAGPAIETKEPDKYRATLVLTAEASGDSGNKNIPTLSAEVGRNTDARRVAFKLPNGEQIIYLDRPDKRYVVMPNRKQYAELTSEALGFDVARLMTPGQVVSYLQRQRGYERVGEEQMDGRTVVKYRYAGTAQTGTQAGNVTAETFVYVDKDTGLPLRTELSSQSSTEVQGIKNLKVVAVMKDISTDVDPTQFDVPQGYSKVDPQQLRQQVEALAAIAKVFLNNMLAQSSGTPTANNSPATPAPTASASPTPAQP